MGETAMMRDMLRMDTSNFRHMPINKSALAKDHPSRVLIRAALDVLKRVERLKSLMATKRPRGSEKFAAVFALQVARARLQRLKADERRCTAMDTKRKSPLESKRPFARKRYKTVCYAKTGKSG